jgi:hypothetical protein
LLRAKAAALVIKTDSLARAGARRAGADPVLDWLWGLPPDDLRAIGTDLATVQFGWPIGMPLCRPLGNSL